MEDVITKEQFTMLKELAALCDNNVAKPVSIFAAAMKARIDKKRAQHLVLSLLETKMVYDFSSQMTCCLTTQGIMYCHHRRGNFIVKLWYSHTEAIIRGLIGATGAITGSIVTLLIRSYLIHRGQ